MNLSRLRKLVLVVVVTLVVGCGEVPRDSTGHILLPYHPDYHRQYVEIKNRNDEIEKEEMRIRKRQETENKLKDLRESARQGDRNAQYELGVISEEGKIVPKNLHDAMTWYDRSVSQGHIDAKKGFNRVASILKERGRLEEERKEQERLREQ